MMDVPAALQPVNAVGGQFTPRDLAAALVQLDDQSLAAVLVSVLRDHPQTAVPIVNFAVPDLTYLPSKAVSQRRAVGFIRTYSQEAGFGLISCPELFTVFGADVYLHRNQAGSMPLPPGTQVSFAVFLNKDNQPQAFDLSPAGGWPGKGWKGKGKGDDAGSGWGKGKGELEQPSQSSQLELTAEQQIEQVAQMAQAQLMQQAGMPECADFKRGTCFRGEACKYVHSAALAQASVAATVGASAAAAGTGVPSLASLLGAATQPNAM